ncbi:MAG: hypothetical protein FRX48_03631 [Lasallia pustulata]|uniref:Uncharacterized protein n=1 Tax=Lasallia pustulata TaxID=136370 RepID=A0A5M8PUC1_9LECA|nr:MAG: hypothetical protein FRX48_03631 [Lasallia pustulata]
MAANPPSIPDSSPAPPPPAFPRPLRRPLHLARPRLANLHHNNHFQTCPRPCGGDGPLPGGIFLGNDPITKIIVSMGNADNHQTTWGVFAAALTALEECMKFYNVWGEAMFHVYDGMNLVGSGRWLYLGLGARQ